MILKALEYLVGLGKKDNKIVEVDGNFYYNKHDYLMPVEFYDRIEEPLFETISTKTLSSLIDFLKTNFEKLSLENDVHIHIVDYNRVLLKSKSFGDLKQKETFMNIYHELEFQNGYRFDSLESFLIHLNTNYVPSPDFDKLLSLVTKVVRDEKQIIEDNGVYQTALVKDGIDLNSKEKIQKIFTLRPFRTFLEVDQPESDFYFRITKPRDEGKTLHYSLYGSDGNFWKLDAMQNINNYLLENLADLFEEIGAEIPIIM